MNSDNCSSIHKHWKTLSTLLQRSPRLCNSLFKQPSPVPVPPLPCVQRLLKRCISLQQKQLLQRHLLAASILFQDQNLHRQELQKIYSLEDIFPDIELVELQSVSWIAFPIAVVKERRAVKITLLLGLKTGNGKCIVQNRPQFSKSSRESLELSVPDGKDLLVWTLQYESDSPVTGHSLALPSALAISFLQNKKKWPEQLLATGELTAGGQVRAVQDIQKKKLLLPGDSALFLVPMENNTPDSDKRVVPVQSIHEAIAVVNHLHQGIYDPQTIRLFQLAAQDAHILLERFNSLPIEFFVLHDLSTVYKKIRNNPDEYIGQLISCFKEAKNRTQLPDELMDLFVCDDILKLAQRDQFTAIQFCLVQLAWQNHYGRTNKSRQWSSLAVTIAQSYEVKKELTSLANNDFINTRFNRYDFRPELPELFKLRLEHEKQLHQLQEDDGKRLGAMYGTLAQNYGFCGPTYLTHLKEMTDKAMDAFGRRDAGEHSRILSYLIYGFLDNDAFTEANTLFCKVFSLPADRPESWIRKIFAGCESEFFRLPFPITLLCRLLAEQPELLERCSWKESRQHLTR
ncbi:MAG TPA: hypothetical protein EYH36_10300, partial [Desulfocapsa sulfexigens]|nr:hypothetical protein [Desulfocapsa sulfexigens]